jgi:hypothetical protein
MPVSSPEPTATRSLLADWIAWLIKANPNNPSDGLAIARDVFAQSGEGCPVADEAQTMVRIEALRAWLRSYGGEVQLVTSFAQTYSSRSLTASSLCPPATTLAGSASIYS